MTAAVYTHTTSLPLVAAMGLSDYCQFKSVEIPFRTGAIAAYEGYLRPFSNDESACHFLRAVERNMPVEITGGRLHVDASNLPKHPFEEFLIDMATPCTILALKFDGTEHPRAFLTNPRMQPRFNQPGHIRSDKSVFINGYSHSALCVYSGNLFRYTEERSRLEQFLDQTTTYIAKHLIWLRTRMLFRTVGAHGEREFVYKRKPNESVSEIDTLLSRIVHWDGYWPGPAAPTGPAQHLATIKRNDECWCWSGKHYGECCRPKDLERNRQVT
jgi:hypothetical protein